MASQLANLLFSAANAPRPSQPAPARPEVEDKDRFTQWLDDQPAAPKRSSGETAQTIAAPASNQQPTSDGSANPPRDQADAVTDAVATAATGADTAIDDTEPPSLADTLLAALAALGLQPDTAIADNGDEAALLDPEALKDIEGALQELSALLGVDMNTLVQQLNQLAKGISEDGAAGAQPDLMKALSAWLGDKLGGASDKLTPDVQAGLDKLVAGLKTLAEALPTEPELASPQLKLTEPVLAGKSATAGGVETLEVAAATAPIAETDGEDSQIRLSGQDGESLRGTREAGTSEPADAANRPNVSPNQAARPSTGQDTTLNLGPTPQSQVDAATAKVDPSIAPRVVQTGYQTSQQQLNLPQIAFELSRQVQDGNSRFQIRLDPPELGRIDIKLDIDGNGQVHARLTVEKAETLDLMQRDQRALERALQQAGLDQNKTNLEFSLKQNPFAGDQNQGSGGDRQAGADTKDGGDDADPAVPAVTLYRGNLSASGLNILA